MANVHNVRIQYLYDTETNWDNTTKVSKKGELYVYAEEDFPRVKIGDGSSTVANLPYVAFTATEVENEVISTVPSVSGSLTYNGTMQTPTWSNYDSSKLILAGDTCGQDAGTYTASFIPQKGYQWGDGTITAKTVNWTIAKASRTISVSSSEVTLDYTTLATSVSISYVGKGTVTMSVDKPSIVTATLANNVIDLVHNNYATGTATISLALSGDNNYNNATKTITVNTAFVNAVLEDNSWATISKISDASQGSNYWSVGDTKKIVINGTVGYLSISNYETYVYILGFDHTNGSAGTDTGIHFGGFKTAASNGIDVCLITNYGSTNTRGLKYFNMSHWGSYNYGGWRGCDMRYDILGSTNQQPSGYGATPTTSKTGYDATSTCATSPVSNTLMAALPGDLRAVMKPMTKYTDGTGNSSNTSGNVVATVDYLPLLAEFEVFGTRTYANQYEKNSQSQYAYFAASNSKVKYQHSATGSAAHWWLRSPRCGSSYYFCRVYDDGSATNYTASTSFGVAPAFKV